MKDHNRAALAEQLAKVRDGDEVRAVFRARARDDGEESAYAIESPVRESKANRGSLYVGDVTHLGRIDETGGATPSPRLVWIDWHKAAPKPFYIGRPAERQPRLGDQIKHTRHGLLIYDDDGQVWWQHTTGRFITVEPGEYRLAGELFEDES